TQTQNVGGFLQDGYSIFPNLTVNAGLRYEQQRIGGDDGRNAIVLGDNWAPRVGVVYDPTNEGRSKGDGHWGRFYESVPMDFNTRLCAAEGTLFGGATSPPCAQPIASWGSGNPSQGWRSCDYGALPAGAVFPSGGVNALVQPNIKGQYNDEIVAGGEYEVLQD